MAIPKKETKNDQPRSAEEPKARVQEAETEQAQARLKEAARREAKGTQDKHSIESTDKGLHSFLRLMIKASLNSQRQVRDFNLAIFDRYQYESESDLGKLMVTTGQN